MAKTVVLRYLGPDGPGDEAIFSLGPDGKATAKLLNDDAKHTVAMILKDGVYCHDDGDKTKMVMPSEGQRFLDNLLLETSARFFAFYDPEAAPQT